MNITEFEKVKLPIIEIFQSVSGEGISAGYIVTFVRVAGCNLRCSYCDTKYSYDEQSKDNQFLSPHEIYEKVSSFKSTEVICTGGEPLENDKAKRFLPLYLAAKGLKVRIETNGSAPIYTNTEINNFCDNEKTDIHYVLDVKCPSSLMNSEMIFEENYILLREGDEMKFVVANEEDIDYSFEIIEKYKAIFSDRNIIINFSPVFGKIEPNALVELLKQRQHYIYDNNLKVRLSLQIHKIIWDPNAKGV
jgi:7-carboxy-7-deazaguanine synthase